MMPKPYSYDLRQRVIEAIELDGMKKSEAVQVFQVSRNTIHLWLAQLAKTGDYQAKPNEPRGNGHKITDWERFKEFVRANGDKTQEEMAKLWEVPISDRTISRALKKIGFSRKKKLMGIEKGMKKKEENSRKS
jgi:transposase